MRIFNVFREPLGLEDQQLKGLSVRMKGHLVSPPSEILQSPSDNASAFHSQHMSPRIVLCSHLPIQNYPTDLRESKPIKLTVDRNNEQMYILQAKYDLIPTSSE